MMLVQHYSTKVDLKLRLTVPVSRPDYGFAGWGPRLGY